MHPHQNGPEVNECNRDFSPTITETECHFNFDLSRNRHAILRSRLKLPCLDSIFSVLILLQRVVQLSYFTFLAYWSAFVGVEENFGYPCYPSPSQLRTEGASMIENIIREVKAEIQRLNQVVRLLEGTKATKQATVTCPQKTSPAEMCLLHLRCPARARG